MKIKYKSVLILLIITLTAFMLVSCGNNENTGRTDKTSQQNVSSSQSAETVQQGNGNGGGHGHHGEHGEGCEENNCISEGQARQIALSKVSGAADSDIVEMDIERDHGRVGYKGSIHYGGYKYDFEIDAKTGNITKWEIDN